MRWVVALALLFLASAAQAQVSPVPPIIAGTLDLGTGTTVKAGAVNVLGALGLQIGGRPGVQISPASGNRSAFVAGAGPNGGLTSSDEFVTAVGDGAAAAIPPGTVLELAAVGTGSSAYVAGGSGYSISVGVSSNGSDNAANHISALGGDDMRNSIGNAFTVAVGDDGSRNGTSTDDAVVGSLARSGCSLCVVFSGTPAANSTLTLTLTTTNGSGNPPTVGLPVSVTYTVPAGGATLATAVAALWNSLNAVLNGSVTWGFATVTTLTMDSNAPDVIPLDFPGRAAISASLTDTASAVTITTAATNTSQDVIAGYAAAGSTALYQGSAFSVLIGSNTAVHAQGFYTGVAIGAQTVQMMNGDNKFAVGGFGSGANMHGTYDNSFWGFQSGNGVGIGNGNSIFGAEDSAASPNCISSGQFNMELGIDACVPSPTANFQLSISNMIYGTNLSGTDYNVSPGSIGIGQPAPGARLDVLGTGTGSELAFRVQSSAPGNLFSVADNGTISVGTSTGATCSGPPTSSFATVNGIVTHC